MLLGIDSPGLFLVRLPKSVMERSLLMLYIYIYIVSNGGNSSPRVSRPSLRMSVPLHTNEYERGESNRPHASSRVVTTNHNRQGHRISAVDTTGCSKRRTRQGNPLPVRARRPSQLALVSRPSEPQSSAIKDAIRAVQWGLAMGSAIELGLRLHACGPCYCSRWYVDMVFRFDELPGLRGSNSM